MYLYVCTCVYIIFFFKLHTFEILFIKIIIKKNMYDKNINNKHKTKFVRKTVQKISPKIV